MPQRIYNELLEQIPAVITYTQTGEIVDSKGEQTKDESNIKWLREKGLLKRK